MPVLAWNRLVLVIPDPPVAKARPRVTFKNGRPHAYTPAKTLAAEHRIQLWAMRAMKGARHKLPLFTGALALSVTVYLRPPVSTPKRLQGKARPAVRPDIDNYTKLALDALGRAGVWRDDGQIVECRSSKYYAWTDQPRWEITIEALEAA